MSAPSIVLASASPRRRELMALFGRPCAVVPSEVDETPQAGEDPARYVERLAREKAEAVDHRPALVVAADTTVVLDGEILGKPLDRDEARHMLRRLAGRTHTVLTGVALRLGDASASAVVTSTVTMMPLTAEDIEWYVATGEPDDKAGAYGLQGIGMMFVERIDGSPSNVIGLPLTTVLELARSLGVDLPAGGHRDSRA